MDVVKYGLLARLNKPVVEGDLKLPTRLGDGGGDLGVQVLGEGKLGRGKRVDRINGPRLRGLVIFKYTLFAKSTDRTSTFGTWFSLALAVSNSMQH